MTELNSGSELQRDIGGNHSPQFGEVINELIDEGEVIVGDLRDRVILENPLIDNEKMRICVGGSTLSFLTLESPTNPMRFPVFVMVPIDSSGQFAETAVILDTEDSHQATIRSDTDPLTDEVSMTVLSILHTGAEGIKLSLLDSSDSRVNEEIELAANDGYQDGYAGFDDIVAGIQKERKINLVEAVKGVDLQVHIGERAEG